MSTWATADSAPIPVTSLKDVMREQLADELQTKEKLKHSPNIKQSVIGEDYDEEAALKLAIEESLNDSMACGTSAPITDDLDSLHLDPGTENDRLLAEMLQKQWNKEQNALVDVKERKMAGNSKVNVSLEKFHIKGDDECDEDVSDDSSDDDYSYDDDELDDVLTSGSTGNYGLKVSGRYKGSKDEPTKHDPEICGRKNTAKVMDLPPEYTSGDGRDMSDVKLSNTAYNKLRTYCQAESKRSNRVHEKKEHSTAVMAVDARTRLLLYKMINNGILESVTGIMASGKESVVLYADGGHHDEIEMPSECAIKIYKTTLTEFKNREQYVRGDHRFSKDDYKKKNPRKIIKLWASKEKGNLLRMTRYGVPCPRVVLVQKHILVMSLIGSNGQAAPQLRHVDLNTVDAQIAFDQTVEIMKKLYKECELVHADLSQYNLLWHDGQVYVIDVSQSVALSHPKAMEFLYRDCQRISEYFSMIGVHEVLSPEQLFCDVTGLSVPGTGNVFLSNLKEYRPENLRFVDLPTTYYEDFNYLYEQAERERKSAQKPNISENILQPDIS